MGFIVVGALKHCFSGDEVVVEHDAAGTKKGGNRVSGQQATLLLSGGVEGEEWERLDQFVTFGQVGQMHQ